MPFVLTLIAHAQSSPEGVPPTPSLPLEDIFYAFFSFFFSIDYSIFPAIGREVWTIAQFVGTFVSLALVFLIWHIGRKTADYEALIEMKSAPAMNAPSTKQVHGKKWQRVLDYLESLNPNDWRLAVLEADILLDEMLEERGVPGESLGERLKATTPAMFSTVQKGWEAHIVRNRLAHEGANYELNQREARRVVGLFAEMLREGGFIS